MIGRLAAICGVLASAPALANDSIAELARKLDGASRGFDAKAKAR